MMPCRSCHVVHDPLLRCEVAARMAASRSVPVPVTDGEAATNAANLGAGATNGVTNGRTLNRRDRADYNAYQRELMRKRRAAVRAGSGGGAA